MIVQREITNRESDRRQAGLQALVAAGEITAEQAALIGVREPSPEAVHHGARLAQRLGADPSLLKRAGQ